MNANNIVLTLLLSTENTFLFKYNNVNQVTCAQNVYFDQCVHDKGSNVGRFRQSTIYDTVINCGQMWTIKITIKRLNSKHKKFTQEQ